ncbi:MAG TPA: MFS transporter, partial [Acidimicrobiales bacterium]|nr:MFS transporter [Acidimicrobiales bacterium]
IAGSTLAALPGGGFALLLVGRSLQGLGLALSALIMATARDNLSELRLPSAIALLAVSTTVGVGLSYPITSLLDDLAGVHAPFWFGTVVASIALLLCWGVVPASAKRDRRPLDVGGAALIGAALLALLIAVTEAHSWSWTSVQVIALLLASAALGWLWVVRERSTSQPLFELKLLANRTVAMTFLTSMIFSLTVYMFVPIVSDFVQIPRSEGYGFGASVFVAGLMLVPFSALSGTVAPIATRISRRVGPSRLILVAGLVVASGLLMFAATEEALWEAFVAMAIVGLGFGNSVAVMPGLIVASVPPEETGSALGFMSVTSFIGLAFGSAIGASILGAYTKAGQLLPGRTGFTVALIVGAGCSIAAALVATQIRQGSAVEASGRAGDEAAVGSVALATIVEPSLVTPPTGPMIQTHDWVAGRPDP